MRKSLRSIFTAAITLLMLTMLVIPVFAATTAKITRQPSSATVASGSTAKVTLAAAGDGKTYKWYFKDRDDEKFALTATYKGASYSVKMTPERSGRQVYCQVTDKYGNSVKSKTVTLTMKGAVKITTQPKSITVANGKLDKVTVAASGSGLKYAWYFKDADSSKFSLTNSFKGAAYSVKMTPERHGRQIYCVITDKYGISVKTNTVTLTMKGAVKITSQPKSVNILEGKTAKTTVVASGSGLKYAWYFKDVGATKYSLTTSFKGASYSVPMTEDRAGRLVYCVVTDKYGISVRSKTVKLSMDVAAKFTKLPPATVSVEEGAKTNIKMETAGKGITYQWYIKNKGSSKFSKSSVTTATYNTTMSQSVDGRQVYCVIKDSKGRTATSNTVTIQMKYNKFLIVDKGVGAVERIGVPASGKYTLKKPVIEGYTFKGWVDKNGKTVASSGTIQADTEVFAVWEVGETTTRTQLIDRTNAGVREIKIAANIAINQPIFISYKTTIYADTNCNLTRAPKYDGDLFVVGQDKKGEPAVLNHRRAELTLGGGKGLLTISGNRKNVTVKVVGSALYVYESATVNILDNACIANNIKLGNKRIYECTTYASEDSLMRAGGAAILNINGTVNMFGGVVRDNLVATTHTVVKDETGAEVKKEYFGCGGAVYNRGNFNMYGGTITTSEALRGGGVYNDRVAYLEAGTISYNESHTYGGGISSSSSSNADTFIGNNEGYGAMVIEGNHSNNAGAGIYSNTWSPIIVYGNTLFKDNVTETSGGAMYSAGPITVRDAAFEGNSCTYSGGAIYHHYANVHLDRRFMTLEGCTFDGNSAGLGGAVILSAVAEAEEKGAFATITNCTFQNNQAKAQGGNPGNGAALYITRKADATITSCTFTNNTAANNAGAIAIHSGSQVKVSDSTFQGNIAAFGGAIYTSSQSNVDMKNLTFTGNAAIKNSTGSGGNAGALYISAVPVTFDNVDFVDNRADNNGGAVYLQGIQLEIDSKCRFEGNTALGHGGAFYLTYTSNSDNTKNGAVLTANGTVFQGNTALAGGAISARTACKADLTDVTLTENSATGLGKDAEGGGAVYVGFGELNLKNVTAEGNTSAGHGGVVVAMGAPVNITGGSYKGNEALSGGVLTGSGNSPLTVKDASFIGNKATSENKEYDTSIGGGAINLTSSNLTVTGSTFDGNSSENYGGTIMTNKGVISITGNTVVKNSSGATGGALYFRGNGDVTLKDISVTDNTSSSNGVIYQTGGKLLIDTVAATGNSGNSGGVLYVSGSADSDMLVTNCDWYGNEANNGGAAFVTGATLRMENVTLRKNTARLGGALYSRTGALKLKDVTFTENSATSNGGAIDLVGGTLLEPENVTFTGNSAAGHGGAVYVSYYRPEGAQDNKQDVPGVMTMTGGIFTENTAMAGGAISIRTGCEATLNGTLLEKNAVTGDDGEADGDADGGGAIYVGYGKLTLNNVTAKENTASGFGGVIASANSQVEITGGTFADNEAASGGALHVVSGGTVKLTDVQFLRNKSTYVQTGEYDNKMAGGAIQMRKGTLEITGCTFDGNSSAYYGGSISAAGVTATIANTTITSSQGATGTAVCFRDSSKVEMTECAVTNTTGTYNGIIYITSGQMTLNKVNTSGLAGYYGGVLYASSAKVTIENCDWQGETARSGGAIYQKGGEITAKAMTFTGFTATSNGGVVYQEGGTFISNGCSFSSNSGTNGGAIYQNGGTAKLIDTTFTENTAHLGGAVYSTAGTVELTNAVFTENTATKNASGSAGNGGAIDIVGSTMTGTATFTNNTAEGHGGAIYLSYINNDDGTRVGAEMALTGSAFTENAAAAGGAISSRTDCSVTVTNCTFTRNSASGTVWDQSGGAIYSNDNTLTVTGCTFDSNSSGYYGGAITAVNANATINGNTEIKGSTGVTGSALYFRSAGTYSLENVVLENNIATSGSGVVYVNGTATLSMKNVTGTGNQNNHGGILYSSGSGDITIEDCAFQRNTARNDGGALCINGSAKVTVKNTQFAENTAKNGGAMQLAGTCVVTAENVTFTSNSAQETGGAICLRSKAALKAEKATFTSNSAQKLGGAIYTESTGLMEISKDSVFTENTAPNGGAVYMELGTNAAISNTTFTGNTATAGNGGAVRVAKVPEEKVEGEEASEEEVIVPATLIMENVVMQNNTATASGGALAAEHSNVNLLDSDIKNNSSALGGAFHFYRGAFTFADSTFTQNTSTSNGGAVALAGTTATGTGNNVFTKNTAGGHAGAFYIAYANNTDSTKTPGVLTMEGGSFTENTASSGGAISSRTSCQVALNGTTLNNNTASSEANGEGGGAIYSNNNTLSLENVTIDGNTSGYYGGAVYATSVEATVEGGTISNNTSTTGVIYITGTGSLTAENLAATGNSNNNGAVIYCSGSTNVTVINPNFTGNTAAYNGGTIDFRSSGELTVTGGTISGNSANNGGAVYTTKGTTEITNCLISENSAKAVGGGVYGIGSANITLNGTTVLHKNTAPAGGGIYLTQGATGTANGITLTENTATSGDGGGILVAESSEKGDLATTLTLTNVTFEKNTASSKGGGLSTDYGSPNLVINATGCVFEENKALGAGGGAVEIQNVNCNSTADPAEIKIVFTNTTFTGNTAKTTGGAVEIRSNSCAKFDGITATGNEAGGNGGVIYVTSLNSRVYVTGAVAQSGNTAAKGAFASLYNSNYANPPKIYTTYGSTAAWVSDVFLPTGTSIVFDLKTMP